MRGRTCVLCRRRLRSRCACLLLAPGKTRNCHQEQKHYPLLQHIFTLQNPIHYRLLTTRTFLRPLHFPKHCPSSEVARSLRSMHHGRHSPISCTWLISSKNGGMACTMRATRLQTRRHGQTVSWGEKTLPEVGRLRNHFRLTDLGALCLSS